jgi:prepilin peptidase CpaA
MSESADQLSIAGEGGAPLLASGVGVATARGGGVLSWLSIWVGLLSVAAVLSAALVVGARGSAGFFLPVLSIGVCILAAMFDASTGRIPNRLTYTAILAGLLFNALGTVFQLVHLPVAATWLGTGATAWGSGLADSLAGFAVCAGIGVVACLMAGVHGGDLKLLAALGALLGLSQTGEVLMLALGIAVLYSLLNLAVVGRLNRVVRIAATRAMELVYLRRALTPLPEDATPGEATHIPMAVPLAMGLLLAQWWHWHLLRGAAGGGVL